MLSALTESRLGFGALGFGALLTLCVAATGCATDGSPASPASSGSSGSSGSGPGGAGAPPWTAAGSGPDADCALPRALVRLPNRRVARAIADLLNAPAVPTITGGGGRIDTLVPGDTPLIPADLAFEYRDVISTAAAQADATRLLACSPGEAEAACVERFIIAFTTRAFRRPVTDDERARLKALFELGKKVSVQRGFELFVQAVLQAPSFLYHRALGSADANGSYALSSYEVAEKLGLLFLDSVPDADLMLAASADTLRSADAIAAQVERLLQQPSVQAQMTWVLDAWLGGGRVVGKAKDATLYGDFSPELQARLWQSKRDQIHQFTWQRGSTLRELFSTPELWLDAGLAKLLGLPAPAQGFVAQPVPERFGILTHPALLAQFATAKETSVVHRGLFLFSDVLCNSVASPPAGAVEEGLEVAKELHTERLRAEYRATKPVCKSCHHQFDPYGLVFESYDAIGRAQAGPDTRATVVVPPSVAGEFQAAPQLLAKVSEAPELTRCAAQRVVEYALARSETEAERCLTDSVSRGWGASGGRLSDLFRSLGTSRALYSHKEGSK
jgi:hypothetical protein